MPSTERLEKLHFPWPLPISIMHGPSGTDDISNIPCPLPFEPVALFILLCKLHTYPSQSVRNRRNIWLIGTTHLHRQIYFQRYFQSISRRFFPPKLCNDKLLTCYHRDLQQVVPKNCLVRGHLLATYSCHLALDLNHRGTYIAESIPPF